MSDKNSSVDNVNDTNGENHLDDLLNDLKVTNQKFILNVTRDNAIYLF